MPSPYATKLAEAFSAKLLEQIYARSIFPQITNSDYSGDVQQGSKVNIPALSRLTEKTYTGANLSPDDLSEIVAVLNVDQAKSFYFKVKSIDEYKSFIKDPASKTINQRANERKKNVDTFVLGFGGDVAAGNRIGTDYTTGTVAVAATTGVVTGTGTTFTSAMVGRGFRASGHVKWYRVKTFNSATEIVIENDEDDVSSYYDGGSIAAGASYVIEAVTPVTLTTANVVARILDLKQRLDDHEVPDEDRFIVIPPIVENILVRAAEVNIAVPAQYEALLRRGFITELAGFKIFRSTRLAGNNTDGFQCIGGTPDWLTFADKILEAGIEEDLIGNFGAAYKDLYVYGAKVADERRKFGTFLFCKV